ncbi:hypothetical protein HJG60_010239 [Phyllostomus discolor]|uniref:Uncharacterized protein n=1 Tax=Phyllostomus discolor TaxID=89673 RepID=A0A834ASN9_9CHIR|nr:hypothetical protein HJG60_010239 [Phyllostomus discolor]
MGQPLTKADRSWWRNPLLFFLKWEILLLRYTPVAHGSAQLEQLNNAPLDCLFLPPPLACLTLPSLPLLFLGIHSQNKLPGPSPCSGSSWGKLRLSQKLTQNIYLSPLSRTHSHQSFPSLLTRN